jgi:hypothetical protein
MKPHIYKGIIFLILLSFCFAFTIDVDKSSSKIKYQVNFDGSISISLYIVLPSNSMGSDNLNKLIIIPLPFASSDKCKVYPSPNLITTVFHNDSTYSFLVVLQKFPSNEIIIDLDKCFSLSVLNQNTTTFNLDFSSPVFNYNNQMPENLLLINDFQSEIKLPYKYHDLEINHPDEVELSNGDTLSFISYSSIIDPSRKLSISFPNPMTQSSKIAEIILSAIGGILLVFGGGKFVDEKKKNWMLFVLGIVSLLGIIFSMTAKSYFSINYDFIILAIGSGSTFIGTFLSVSYHLVARQLQCTVYGTVMTNDKPAQFISVRLLSDSKKLFSPNTVTDKDGKYYLKQWVFNKDIEYYISADGYGVVSHIGERFTLLRKVELLNDITLTLENHE